MITGEENTNDCWQDGGKRRKSPSTGLQEPHCRPQSIHRGREPRQLYMTDTETSSPAPPPRPIASSGSSSVTRHSTVARLGGSGSRSVHDEEWNGGVNTTQEETLSVMAQANDMEWHEREATKASMALALARATTHRPSSNMEVTTDVDWQERDDTKMANAARPPDRDIDNGMAWQHATIALHRHSSDVAIANDLEWQEKDRTKARMQELQQQRRRMVPRAERMRGSHEIDHDEQSHEIESAFPVVSGVAPTNPASILSVYAIDDSDQHEAQLVTDQDDPGKRRQRSYVYGTIALIVIIITTVALVVPILLSTTRTNMNGQDGGLGELQPFIENLCSPRHLTIYNNRLFVPEAGVGVIEIPGDRETMTVCLESTVGAIPAVICFGNTGQVRSFALENGTEITPSPLVGLISGRTLEGSFTNQVNGPSAVDFDDEGNMFTLLGLGYVDAVVLAAQDPTLVFASILKNNQGVVASPWVPIFEHNYSNESVKETNPFDLCVHDAITYVVDAGADLLLTYLNVETAGTNEPDSVIALPKIGNVPAVEPNPRGGPCTNIQPPAGPPFCGQYQDAKGNWLYSTSSVPTAVRVNPNEPNRIYVAYLAGAIWNAPVSGILFMDLVDGIPQEDTLHVIRGDFWAIIDFDFYDNDIIVLETNPGGFVPFGGRLSRLTMDPNDASIKTHDVFTEDLFQPSSLTVHDTTIYVTNNTFNMGINDCNGQILKANLKVKK